MSRWRVGRPAAFSFAFRIFLPYPNSTRLQSAKAPIPKLSDEAKVEPIQSVMYRVVVVTQQKRNIYSRFCVDEHCPHTYENNEKVYDDRRNRHDIRDVHDGKALRETVQGVKRKGCPRIDVPKRVVNVVNTVTVYFEFVQNVIMVYEYAELNNKKVRKHVEYIALARKKSKFIACHGQEWQNTKSRKRL